MKQKVLAGAHYASRAVQDVSAGREAAPGLQPIGWPGRQDGLRLQENVLAASDPVSGAQAPMLADGNA
jgi:hypothetical protein